MMSLATAPREVESPFQPPKGSNAETAGAIARGSGEIGACDPQTNVSHANGCQSPSILSSATTSDLPDEDDIIGAWVYKNWAKFR
jgi:hypothetical protein